jgi:hypothetical protein
VAIQSAESTVSCVALKLLEGNGSRRPSKHLVFWQGYVPPVGKSQSAQRMHMGLRKSSHPQSHSNRWCLPWHDRTVCVPQVADLQLNIIYQQDWAPPHWSLHIWETLMRTFPDRFIGHDGPISCPRVRRTSHQGFLFLGVRQGPSVCYPCAWPSNFMRLPQ